MVTFAVAGPWIGPTPSGTWYRGTFEAGTAGDAGATAVPA